MCKITKHLKFPIEADGYKLVVVGENGFYSPCTGLEYKVGMKLPNMTKPHDMVDGMWVNPLNKEHSAYEPIMKGKTGVFIEMDSIFKLRFALNRYLQYGILKMKLGNITHMGVLDMYETYIGSEILKIELVKIGDLNSDYSSLGSFDNPKRK
jgi:hypothetical protein